MREDYYELLDMPPTADKQELRSAYRRLAMRYHPDHNGDAPEAEERFKLIAEAWRTLGDDEKRADYDAWLERHRRYVHMPELAAMPQRHARVSSRQGAERRRERADSRREARMPRRVRPFLLRHVPRVGYLRYVLMSLCALLAMQPFIRAYSGSSGAHSADKQLNASALPPGESPLSPEVCRERLESYVQHMVQSAQDGDAQAQYRYGSLLYQGREGSIPQNTSEALHWLHLSAAQGNKNALRLIDSITHPQGSSAAEPAAEDPAPQSRD